MIERGFTDVHLFEKNTKRTGGLIASYRPASKFGLVETAANAFLANADIVFIAERIGTILVPAARESRVRLIWRHQKARRWPLTFGETLTIGWRLLKNITRLKPRRHETLGLWTERIAGPAAAQYVVSPAFQGVYAAPADALSAELIVQSVRRKSLLAPKPLRGSVAPIDGLQDFLDKLKKYLVAHGCEFHLGETITDLRPREGKGEVQVIATNATDAGRLAATLDADLGLKLQRLPMLGLVSATAFFKMEDRHHRAFGCLFPRGEGIEALGVLLNNFIFPDRGPALSETWIYGDDHANESSSRIAQMLVNDRLKLTGRPAQLLGCEVNRWPGALPRYSWELRNLLESGALDLLTNRQVHFIGNYLGTIGLAKIATRARDLADTMTRRYRT